MKAFAKYTPAPETDEQRQRREAKEAERKRKYPHAGMEVGYLNSFTHWILCGNDATPFAESLFYVGMQDGQPVFSAPQDGVIVGTAFTSREAAHKAMTALLAWYETHAVPVPAGLGILSH